MPTAPTGVESALSLDGIYYSAPIPRNPAVLTVLGAVFDRIHFPNVYLPTSGYDLAELDKEIARLQGLDARDGQLEAVLSFVKYAKVLEGFCVFTPASKRLEREEEIPNETLKELFCSIHGPTRPGWEPMFMTNYTKSLPGGDEFIAFPGSYHYLAHAIKKSGETGMPIVSDLAGLPIPGFEDATAENNAQVLSTLLAIEATKLALPALPVLRPEELMEFRADNNDTLRRFRRGMLTYAADLNGKIKGLKPGEVQEATKFFVQTEIVPALDALREAMNAPARPWYKRIIEGASVLAQVGPSFFTMPPEAAVATALSKFAAQFAVELMAEGDHRDALKRSGLYYLLKLERFKADRP